MVVHRKTCEPGGLCANPATSGQRGQLTPKGGGDAVVNPVSYIDSKSRKNKDNVGKC